jgi:hypothetical protein
MATNLEATKSRFAPWRRLTAVIGGLAALTALYGGFWLAGDAIAAGGDRPGKKTNDPNIIPIEDIKPGMTGYALTVFKGQTPDKFEIEVVDVVRDYLTGQDAVLFRSPDPRMQHSGIVGGMSGSPIYIQGKLAGALAYGYRFNKEPLGGMAPIENMLEIADLPHRPELRHRRSPRAGGRSGTAAWADQMLALGTDPLPERMLPEQIPTSRGAPSGGLEPIGAPMSIAGLSPHAAQFLADATGLLPVRGGGSQQAAASSGQGAEAKTKHAWKPGDSVSVVLIAGDNGAAPNGTITWVGPKGNELLAFGHPMYGDGPSRYPIANAHVHTILAGLERSVKLSSPLDIQGTMIQDRQPAIYLRTDVHTPMVPVVTTVTAAEDKLGTRTYRSSVADSETLTPALVVTLLLDAIEEAGGDAVDVVLETHHEISIETSKGPRVLDLYEESYFARGIIRGLAARSRALLVMLAALDNDFEVAEITSVKQSAKIHYGAPVETIERIRIGSGELRAGELLEILVDLKPPRGPARTELVSLRIPKDAGDERIVVELSGGELVMPYAPLPNSVDDLLDNLAASYPVRSIVGTIYRSGEGLATRHGLLDTVPESVLQTLSPAGSNRKAVHFKQAARRVIRTDSIIRGEATLELDILPARTI